jgi:hypothetical protein
MDGGGADQAGTASEFVQPTHHVGPSRGIMKIHADGQ